MQALIVQMLCSSIAFISDYTKQYMPGLSPKRGSAARRRAVLSQRRADKKLKKIILVREPLEIWPECTISRLYLKKFQGSYHRTPLELRVSGARASGITASQHRQRTIQKSPRSFFFWEKHCMPAKRAVDLSQCCFNVGTGSQRLDLNPYSAGIDFRRHNQILTSKVDPRIVGVKICIMTVDLYHRYSKESERAE